VQSFTAEDLEMDRLSAVLNTRVSEIMRVQRLNLGFEMSIGTFTALATAFVLGAGGISVLDGHATVGDLLVLSTYIGLLFAPIVTAATLMQGFVFAKGMATRVFELLDAGREVPEPAHPVDFPPAPSGSRVVLENVTFGYAEQPVLLDVDLAVNPGERVAI